MTVKAKLNLNKTSLKGSLCFYKTIYLPLFSLASLPSPTLVLSYTHVCVLHYPDSETKSLAMYNIERLEISTKLFSLHIPLARCDKYYVKEKRTICSQYICMCTIISVSANHYICHRICVVQMKTANDHSLLISH